jgi:hypothetical protein
MRAAALDKRDVGQAPLAEPVAETGDKLKARRAAADDDDSMRLIVAGQRRHEIRSPLPLRARAVEGETGSPSIVAGVEAQLVARAVSEPQSAKT